jgi:hypothetical protein
VRVVPQMPSLPFDRHGSGIRVGGTDHEISHAPIGTPYDLPIRFPSLEGPVGALFIMLSKRCIFFR